MRFDILPWTNRNKLKSKFYSAAVESINLSLSASDQHVDDRNFLAHHTLVFVENMPSTVSCRATGGYPPPDLTIHIDKSDVTDEFSLQHRISYSGKKSLRRLIFTSWRMKHGAMMKRSDDGRRITCVATVPGLQSNSTSAIVTVHREFCHCLHPAWITFELFFKTSHLSLAKKHLHLLARETCTSSALSSQSHQRTSFTGLSIPTVRGFRKGILSMAIGPRLQSVL